MWQPKNEKGRVLVNVRVLCRHAAYGSETDSTQQNDSEPVDILRE